MSPVLADLPVPIPVTDEDLALAAHEVRVDARELWTQGQGCRGERVPYPCRLARWAHAAIHAADLTEEHLGEPA